MNEITTIGMDIAKSVFQLHGVDGQGQVVVRRRVARARLLSFMAQQPVCVVAMEACGGAHHWGRQLQGLGHTVRLISPQFVKPYVKGNKNDGNDAAAICEAVRATGMRFVALKSIEQQDMLAVHRVRALLVRQRTALANQLRGLLAERGLVIRKSLSALRRALPELLGQSDESVSPVLRALLLEAQPRLAALDEHVRQQDQQIEQACRASPLCERLRAQPGVGALSATAFAASVGDARLFKNARQCAAWLGLVPHQHSSGGQTRLLGISKRGDTYLRTLLIHGARAVLRQRAGKTDRTHVWLQGLVKRRGMNIAAVALANKNARHLWALMAQPL